MQQLSMFPEEDNTTKLKVRTFQEGNSFGAELWDGWCFCGRGKTRDEAIKDAVKAWEREMDKRFG